MRVCEDVPDVLYLSQGCHASNPAADGEATDEHLYHSSDECLHQPHSGSLCFFLLPPRVGVITSS